MFVDREHIAVMLYADTISVFYGPVGINHGAVGRRLDDGVVICHYVDAIVFLFSVEMTCHNACHRFEERDQFIFGREVADDLVLEEVVSCLCLIFDSEEAVFLRLLVSDIAEIGVARFCQK